MADFLKNAFLLPRSIYKLQDQFANIQMYTFFYILKESPYLYFYVSLFVCFVSVYKYVLDSKQLED